MSTLSQCAAVASFKCRADELREKPFTLVLSAGFFGFFAHTGFLQTLEELELEPDRVVGASAGALAGGLWSAGLSARQLQEELARLRRSDFWDPGLPLGGLLKGQRFEGMLERIVASQDVRYFEDCVRPFSAVVFDLLSRQTRCIDRGQLVPAIRASCAVPFMFRPVRVGWRYCVDGGLLDRPALSGTREGECVVHHELPSSNPWTQFNFRKTPTVRPEHHLVVDSLPRLGPFQLARGMEAIERGRQAARDWLLAPL